MLSCDPWAKAMSLRENYTVSLGHVRTHGEGSCAPSSANVLESLARLPRSG